MSMRPEVGTVESFSILAFIRTLPPFRIVRSRGLRFEEIAVYCFWSPSTCCTFSVPDGLHKSALPAR